MYKPCIKRVWKSPGSRAPGRWWDYSGWIADLNTPVYQCPMTVFVLHGTVVATGGRLVGFAG